MYRVPLNYFRRDTESETGFTSHLLTPADEPQARKPKQTQV